MKRIRTEEQKRKWMEYCRRYRGLHPEYGRKYSIKYGKEHTEERKKYNEKYHKEYPEKMREYKRKWSMLHREKEKERQRKRYRDNLEKERKRLMELARKQRKEHPEREREYQRKYSMKVRNTPKGKIDARMSNLVWRALRGTKADRTWKSLVDYTSDQLKQHIEKLFTKEMNWKRFMTGEIHIDHVVPQSRFHYSSPEDPQFKECWALHNLQPMWAKDNIRKGNRNYQLQLPLA